MVLRLPSGFQPAKSRRPNDNSPSVDRLVPHLGYVPGNVRVISWRANILRRDATTRELKKLVKYLNREGVK
ncbi:restriction endonuclease pacI-beta-alpha-metal hnh motif 1.97A [Caudoviricetes sp.]|nr:restriction endonuclease pacI-beta-alpha-metal hnh motif 1.97A [Caudoviricetes sp.]